MAYDGLLTACSRHGAMSLIKDSRTCSSHIVQVAERAAFMRFMAVFTLLQFAFAFSVWAFYSNLFALFAGAPPVTARHIVFSAAAPLACRELPWAACCCTPYACCHGVQTTNQQQPG